MSTVTDVILGMIVKRTAREPERVTLATTLDELGFESLDLIEMTFDLEERFNIEIPLNANSAIPAFKTVGDVVLAVEGLVQAAPTAP